LPKIARDERLQIAARRLVNILEDHTISLARTLEQKISDAGPYRQRIQPHLLTEARENLEREGRILALTRESATWYYLHNTPARRRTAKLSTLLPIYRTLNKKDFTLRMG
jgi:hypothetical protein